MYWIIWREAQVKTPGQTSNRNTKKNISSEISSQQKSGKNSENKINLP